MRYRRHKRCCPTCGSKWYGIINDGISQMRYECRDCGTHFYEPVLPLLKAFRSWGRKSEKRGNGNENG